MIAGYTLPVRVLETSVSVLWWNACNFSVIPWILSASEDPTWHSVEAPPVLLTLLLEVVCDVIAAQAVVEESMVISWEPTNADNTRLLIPDASAHEYLVYEYFLLLFFIAENAVTWRDTLFCPNMILQCASRIGNTTSYKFSFFSSINLLMVIYSQ